MSYRAATLLAGIALALSSQVHAKPAKPAPAPAAPVPFEIAHNLGPTGESRLQALVDHFNQDTGSSLKLVRLEKGAKPAALNLVVRYDMSEVLSQSKQFAPLHEVMAKAGQPLKNDIASDIKVGVVDAKGRLVALPMLYSTPVLFYNKNAFRKAGLDPERAPRTWFEMQGMLDKLQDAGFACPYTSSWPVWVHIDNVSSISGVPAASDKGQLTFNGLPQVKHIAMMATWTKANFFKLYGRRGEASEHFHNGECAMITTNSREAVDFEDAKGVELGIAPIPYHDDVYGGRQATLADGAALWIGAGRSPAEYKQVAKFVNFVLSPEIQVEFVRSYGALPLTAAARAAMQSKLFRDGNKALEVAYASLKGGSTTPMVRIANIDPVRIVTNEELEAVWADRKPAKAALDNSVNRGNSLLSAKPDLRKAQPF